MVRVGRLPSRISPPVDGRNRWDRTDGPGRSVGFPPGRLKRPVSWLRTRRARGADLYSKRLLCRGLPVSAE